MTERRVKMLFICTGNSARSQMAEGLTRAMSDGQVECYSAGTEPKPIHPLAIRAMAEVGLDISKNVSKGLAQFLDEDFDYVISVCARAAETCPTWPRSREQIRWHFDDPAERRSEEDRLRVFRRVRNEIQQRLSLMMLAAKIPMKLPKASSAISKRVQTNGSSASGKTRVPLSSRSDWNVGCAAVVR